MDMALLIARLLLAAVFAVAGLAKLADRGGSRQAITDFGLPARLAAPMGMLLPVAELVIAVALLPVSTAWWGALGAAALLLLFVAGIAFNLARGRKPDCHCFGQIYSAPVGWPTLVRNGVLAAVAGFVVWQGQIDPGPSVVSWLGALRTAEIVGLIGGVIVLGLLAAGGWLLLNLMRQNGRLLARLDALEARLATGEVAAAPAEVPAVRAEGLPVGAPAPTFSLSGLYGELLTLDFLRAADKPVMLIFSDPACGPCNGLLPEIARWQRDHAAEMTLALVSRGTREANRAKTTEHGLRHVVLQQDRGVADAYQSRATPSAVIIQPDGTIGSPLAVGADQIRTLVARTAGRPAPTALANSSNGNGAAAVAAVPAAANTGAAAPSLRLPDLTGKTVDLADFRGNKTLVLFWNPGCGFCQRMLEDLKAWEAEPPVGAPKLLVVSTGTVEANRALGLRSPVLIDQDWKAGGAFGANGTPSAVLVDEDGGIASQVAVGAPPVLALAGAQPSTNGANGNGAAVPLTLPVPKVGDPAPKIKLPDLAGKPVDLARFRGSKTLVLFWNSSCGPCHEMLDELKAWEANPQKGAPRLLVVSSGTAEANRELGFRAPVLLDQGFTVTRACGVKGTPSAILVDERGKIGSHLAVGAPSVLAVAQGQRDPALPSSNGNGNGVLHH